MPACEEDVINETRYESLAVPCAIRPSMRFHMPCSYSVRSAFTGSTAAALRAGR
jgi:hypothetical protein